MAMLTMKAQTTLRNAESYFREHLGVGDYYMEGHSVSGQWFGKGAKELKLSGATTEKDFLNLCHNLHPQTEGQLTPRMNTKRNTVDQNGNVHGAANRRVFYDFTLSPPKSVSIAGLVGNDKRIIEAHDEAVTVAMRHLQIYAATRVRKQNQYSQRATGNVVGAVFRHDTSRALDPHLHSHCILFNATWDSTEGRWKALEACEMVTAQKFVRNVYYHELVRSLQKFGYGVENNPRGDFEIIGVGKELIDRFSKRHREIDEKTKEFLEREPDKANQNIKVIRANIAHNRIRPVPFKEANKITVCQPKELSLSGGDRLQLKANAQSQDGRRLANGELVTVKQIHADGRIALADGRTLAKDYQQFVHGYAVTSYAAQGKTVDYVLFSDSAVKAATNEQQWYVTISRGRKGVKIFTADKGQLRENISRGGARTLGMDMKPSAFQKLATVWGRNVAFVLNVQASQRASSKRAAEMAQHETLEREAEALRQAEAAKQSQSVKSTESVKPIEKPSETIKPPVQKPQTVRRRMEIPQPQTNQKSKGMRV